MGLEDSLMTSAISAHDVIIKSRCSSALSVTSTKDRAAALENNVGALSLNGDKTHNKDETMNASIADAMEDQNNDCEICEDEICDVNSMAELEWQRPDEYRLSKALHSWMPQYIITPLSRQELTAREPVFSARLGREASIRRSSSCESIETKLSIFSCSSYGSKKAKDEKRRRQRRRRSPLSESRLKSAAGVGQGSRWVQLAKRRKGELDRFMMTQSHILTQAINLIDESEAFRLFDADERQALFACGRQNKLAFAANLRKSSSTTNIRDEAVGKPRQRTASASTKTFYGKPLDFQELRRQTINRKLAALAHQRSSKGRRVLHRSHSRHSLTSVGSSDIYFSATTTRANTPPAVEAEDKDRKKSGNSMWKADAQILAIDLRRELTAKVKQRIRFTTTALERVTGVGDDNEQRPYSCHLPEFPAYVSQDFAVHPKIAQKIRISPHLSDVIKSDIRVRMGRPRYHEIRVRDLEIWNRGQTLDRAHRNLKVFNWLHSLNELEFDVIPSQGLISDTTPHIDDYTFGEMILIRAVDEPDIKPLYQHNKKSYVR